MLQTPYFLRASPNSLIGYLRLLTYGRDQFFSRFVYNTTNIVQTYVIKNCENNTKTMAIVMRLPLTYSFVISTLL